jgi:sugar phosphate isomerase/epimerase
MHNRHLTRRDALGRTGLLLGAALASPQLRAASSPTTSKPTAPFRYCFNTATIRGQKLGIVKEIEITAKAGYDAIEPWVDTLDEFVKSGGNLGELKGRITEAGLTVEDAIGFPEWLAEDDARRSKGLERAKREMDLVAQVGGKRFAAPPAGATDLPKIEFTNAVERYRALLEAGDQIGIVPQFELWGFSKNFHHLGECIGVAMETGHPKACVLADVFHLYKGGSDFRGIHLLGANAIQVLHMNDYPADPPREKIDDSYRAYPGDGTAPLPEILGALHQIGGQKVLSLELFSRKYWTQDPLEVARAGLAKMKAVVEKVQL